MSSRDSRYRNERDEYRQALIRVAAAAVLGGITAALDLLPEKRGLHAEVQQQVNALAREVERLTRLGA